jgi:amino acid permease
LDDLVICRKCGTEIAAKALICYRCGTATTEPQFKPAAPKRAAAPLIVTLLALALLVIVAAYMGRAAAGENSRLLGWVAVAVAVVVVGLRAYMRRR